MQVVGGSSLTSRGNRLTRTKRRVVCGVGCQIKLDDGSWYTDFAMGLHGPIAGYSPDWLLREVNNLGKDSCSIPSIYEQKAADRLQEFYPNMDSVRFMSDGSSPNEAAVRLARAFTKRKQICFCGYHGTGTSFPHNPEPSDFIDERRGIPGEMWKLTKQFKWMDFDAIENLPYELAAIIIEVPPQDSEADLFLAACSGAAEGRGALLIIDDVVTGFRVSPGGAQERYHVEADLVCVGKALGNGFNVSALIGNDNIMRLLTEGVHFSSTYNGSGLATGVAAATLKWISENKETIYPTLYTRGELLKNQMNGVFDDFDRPAWMVGNATRPILINYEEDWLNKWRDGMFKRGFYCLAHPFYVTMAHTEEVIYRTVEASYETCKEIAAQ